MPKFKKKKKKRPKKKKKKKKWKEKKTQHLLEFCFKLWQKQIKNIICVIFLYIDNFKIFMNAFCVGEISFSNETTNHGVFVTELCVFFPDSPNVHWTFVVRSKVLG